MLSTCKQVDKSRNSTVSPTFSDDKINLDGPSPSTPKAPEGQENLMIHRLKDLFSVQNDGRMVNCPKLGVYIPKDFV